MSESAAELPAGRVGRPHGLDGSFYVTGPVPRLLTLGASVGVAGRLVEIVRRSGTDARPILRLQGVDSRDDAEALRGAELTVTASGAPRLGDGEWWAHELERCEVFDGEHRVGLVSRLIELPSCEAIEVQRPGDGDPLLVPLVKDAIRRVDVGAGRIDVDGEFLDLPPRESGTTRRSPGHGSGDRDSRAAGEGDDDGD